MHRILLRHTYVAKWPCKRRETKCCTGGIIIVRILTHICIPLPQWIKNIHSLAENQSDYLCTISISNVNTTKTRQIWGIWKLRPAYSPETTNLGQNRWCFVLCDLEIWWMTLENNRASLLCCFKLCVTFHSHRWIQTRVTVRKRPIWVKFDDF